MARTKKTARGDTAALGEARLKEIEEEKKAKAREASRKSMANAANCTPEEKAADRLVQNSHSAKHRLWHRLDILKAEDARRHSDPDKP
ncbi:hypothetical protein BDZ89DRAFT_1144855 [Hymenopellis radicata]|nr:hypothetical protein BDZ89DRAFT_1144855 [Hymenopellis radicata]